MFFGFSGDEQKSVEEVEPRLKIINESVCTSVCVYIYVCVGVCCCGRERGTQREISKMQNEYERN